MSVIYSYIKYQSHPEILIWSNVKMEMAQSVNEWFKEKVGPEERVWNDINAYFKLNSNSKNNIT